MKDFLHIVTQIIIGVFIFNELRKRMDEKFAIAISIGCILLFYVHPIPLLYLTWKHSIQLHNLYYTL